MTEPVSQPLDALHVLDLSDSVAGAFCSKLLADFGADVVKAEPPAGDPARTWDPSPDEGAGEPGLLYAYLNANKRGVTLDVTTDSGRELLQSLISRSDVVIESYRPEVSVDLRLSYDALGAQFPSLCWLSITPFGQSGPYAHYRASDLVIQAAAGWMFEGGEPDREPLKTGGAISEYITGLLGAVAAIAAWQYRRTSGLGQHVDLSAFEAVQSTGGYGALAYSVSGAVTGRAGQPFPFAILPCADGYVGVNVLTPTQWEMLCAFMERPDLAADPRFATPLDRRANGEELTRIVGAWAAQHTREELFAANEWRVPITTIPTVADLLGFAQHADRGYFVEQQLSGRPGMARRPGAPFKLSAVPFTLRRSAPALGEHNEEIYCDVLGVNRSELKRLRAAGVV